MKHKTPKHHENSAKRTIEIATSDEVSAFARRSDSQVEPAAERTEIPASETPPAAQANDDVDWKDKYLRAKADFQNLQRRAAEEQLSATRYANASFARALLEVVDDFERSLEAAGELAAGDSVVSGIRLVYEKLMKVLQDNQVQVIDAVGQPFDPNCHEALLQQPAADRPANTVLQQVQRGYKLHERVLRPARVIVSADASNPAGDADSGSEDVPERRQGD